MTAKASLLTTDELYNSLDGLEHTDFTGATTRIEHDGKGGLVTQFNSGDLSKHVEFAKLEKSMAVDLDIKPDFDNDGLVKLFHIPSSIATLWWIRDGFHVSSAAKSNMTSEEHQKELFRKVQTEFPVFNVSKYNRV